MELKDYIDARLVHEIHTSERRSFRGCRRRWDWIFHDFYYPKVTAKPLEFGVAFHLAMETLYSPDTWFWPRDKVLKLAIDAFTEKCAEQQKAFLDLSQQYMLPPEYEDDYSDRIDLGIGMLKYIAEKLSPVWDKGWKPIAVEQEFIVAIENPLTGEGLWCRCDRCWKTWTDYNIELTGAPYANDKPYPTWEGLPVCLAGRLDLLAEDTYGQYWVVDWKTAARLSTDREEFLALDDQISSYVMGLRRKLGLNVAGFVYIELKKGYPQPPKENKQRRLGCLYSVAKNQDTDYDTYLAHVMKNDPVPFNEGVYDDFLDWLQNEGPKFSARYQVVKTDVELEEIELNLWNEAADMTDPNLRIYPSAGRFSCSFCAFRQPCLEKNNRGDYQFLLDELYDRRKEHYWVKELSTDKQGGE